MSRMKLGDSLPVLKLKNESGDWVVPGSLSNGESMMVMIYSPECDYTRAYAVRMGALFSHFMEDEVQIYFVNIHPQSHAEDRLKDEIKKAGGNNNNFLADPKGEVIEKFSPDVTPEVFVFDRAGKLSYQGAIDNDWKNPEMVTRVYLEDAMEYTLDAIEVDFPEISPVGTPVEQLAGRTGKH